jgi:hypothetical protein
VECSSCSSPTVAVQAASNLGGLDLPALLITPVQRVPRYILLLREMVKVAVFSQICVLVLSMFDHLALARDGLRALSSPSFSLAFVRCMAAVLQPKPPPIWLRDVVVIS